MGAPASTSRARREQDPAARQQPPTPSALGATSMQTLVAGVLGRALNPANTWAARRGRWTNRAPDFGTRVESLSITVSYLITLHARRQDACADACVALAAQGRGVHGKLRKDAFGVLRGRLERQCISQPRCAGRPRRLATNVLGNQYEPATHAVMGFGQPGQQSTANQMFVWGKCHKCVALTLISRSNRLPRSPTLLKALYCTGSWAGNLPAPSCLGRCALFSAISRPPTRCSAP